MPDDSEPKQFFLNRRDWGSYLSALQAAANYPKVLQAVQSSREWFTQGAFEASNWLTTVANCGMNSAGVKPAPLG